ncbi:ribonuclease III [Mycoplasma sp. 2575]
MKFNGSDLKILDNVLPFLKQLGVKTKELSDEHLFILITAFTHKSFTNEHKTRPHNEYLEFIGDGVLQFVVTSWIANKFPQYEAGLASKLRSSIVDKNNLAKIVEKYSLFKWLRYGNSAFSNGTNIKTKSNLYEAFIGAIYLVYGIEGVKKITDLTLWESFNSQCNKTHVHPKSELQELLQQFSHSRIEYVTEMLPNNEFGSIVLHESQRYGEGYGKSKKEAETNAAINALKKLRRK